MLRAFCLSLLLSSLLLACGTRAQSPPSAEEQIAAAVKAAPAAMRDGATVLGYNDSMELTTLREGDGALVCLADDPSEDNFHVACYHESLEPFMKRGRELRRQGKTAVDSIRQAEIENGSLSYPDHPATLYNLSGPTGAYNAEADSVRNPSRTHVLYVPYETAQTTGLPTQPQGGPWLMAPGKPWAHVMISQ